MLFDLATRLDAPIDVVSRSDSTLRGHVIAEVRALDAARRQVTGRGFDGVLLVPAYFEAGRFTAGNVHWARVAPTLPASETEFARDATFGYSASDLRDFVAEKSGGAVQPGDVLSVTHDDIRLKGRGGWPSLAATGGGFVVVNAVERRPGRGRPRAARGGSGRQVLPVPQRAVVRAVLGRVGPAGPAGGPDLWAAGHPAGHGLVVVGSHVGLTSWQVAVTRDRGGLWRGRIGCRRRRRPRPARWPRRRGHPAGRLGARPLRRAARHQPRVRRGRDATESLEISRRCPPPSPRWSAERSRPSPPGSWPRAASPRTMWPSTASGSGGPGPRPAAPRHGVGLPPDRRRPRGCRHALCRVRRQRRRRDDPGVGRRPGPRESLMPARSPRPTPGTDPARSLAIIAG